MLFTLDDIRTDSSDEQDNSGILSEQFIDTHVHRIRSIRNLKSRPPLEGEIFFLWTVKSFNTFTFIPYIIGECGVIDELILSTYSINIRIIDALIKLIDAGKIRTVVILVSDSIKTLRYKVNDHLSAVAASKPVQLIYAWNHSKIALIKAGDNWFDVEGSGNFSENALHEQYIFLNNRKVYEFRKNEILYAIDRRPD